MLHWPGNPEVVIEQTEHLERGDVATVSSLSLGVHTGTHVDAPVHFIVDGSGVDAIRLDRLIGPARVLDVGDVAGSGRAISRAKTSAEATASSSRHATLATGRRKSFAPTTRPSRWKRPVAGPSEGCGRSGSITCRSARPSSAPETHRAAAGRGDLHHRGARSFARSPRALRPHLLAAAPRRSGRCPRTRRPSTRRRAKHRLEDFMTTDGPKLRSQRLRQRQLPGRRAAHGDELDRGGPRQAAGPGRQRLRHGPSRDVPFPAADRGGLNGVFEAGGKPGVFTVSDICDGVAQATTG